MNLRGVLIGAAVCMTGGVGAALGQWDPTNGQWGKSTATDVRVMTWNVRDGICSTNSKTEGFNNWTALARIVAAMKPDVLILQETGDNAGNGTGCCVDSVSGLTATFDEFLRGGAGVTAWVQKYDPSYDLPFAFVSGDTDNFNRNVVLSRFPFVDLNGDGQSTLNDIPNVLADLYAPGGDGGIRGFQFVEIDLDDGTYRGDVVVGNAHLKAGGSTSDKAQRLTASQNVAYVIDYWFNGADAGTPDPNGRILDIPSATSVLDSLTPVVFGGDWNEDEQTNARKGPAEWLTRAQITGGLDGADRDRTDATYDAATEFFTGSRNTRSSSKLDYLAWQDSVTTRRRQFIFNTLATPSGALPPEIVGATSAGSLSLIASDHLPVIIDFIMPIMGDFDGNGFVDLNDFDDFSACFTGSGPAGLSANCQIGDFDRDDDVDCADWDWFKAAWTGAGSPPTFLMCDGPGIGACCSGTTCSSPTAVADCNNSGGVYQGDGTNCGIIECPSPGDVIISEIMYNPASSEAAPNDVEWVELYNVSTNAISIEGWYLQDEDGLTGPVPGPATIDPGQAVVLIGDDQSGTDFAAAWGSGAVVHVVSGWNSGLASLDDNPSASNELLTVRDSSGVTIDAVNFDDASPWPVDVPEGPSIYLPATALDAVANDDGANWARSVDGTDAAFTNTVTADYDGADVGSPGVVSTSVPECFDATDCDDLIACTVNTCVDGACVYVPDDAACSNGVFCDGAETCNPASGCQGGSDPCPGMVCDEASLGCVECLTAADCDDGIFCTINECIASQCIFTPDDSVCSNGFFCDGIEPCDPQAGCLFGSDPCPGQLCDEVNDVCVSCQTNDDCNDSDTCTQDRCTGQCENPPRAFGDVDDSGTVGIFDLFCILDGLAGTFSDPCTLSNVDLSPCEGDGVISVFDLFALLDALAGVDACCGGP